MPRDPVAEEGDQRPEFWSRRRKIRLRKRNRRRDRVNLDAEYEGPCPVSAVDERSAEFQPTKCQRRPSESDDDADDWTFRCC